MLLAEVDEAAGGIAYLAPSVAIKRFEKRLQIDRDLRRKLTAVEKLLKIQTRSLFDFPLALFFATRR